MECIYVDIHTLRKIDIPDSYFVVHRSWDWSTGETSPNTSTLTVKTQVGIVRCIWKPTNGTLIIITRTLRYARWSSCLTYACGMMS